MTCAAEHGRRNRGKLLYFFVDQLPTLIRVGSHPVFLSIIENALQFLVAGGPKDRFRQSPLNQRQAAAGLVVGLVDTVTNDAGDALTRRRMPLQI